MSQGAILHRDFNHFRAVRDFVEAGLTVVVAERAKALEPHVPAFRLTAEGCGSSFVLEHGDVNSRQELLTSKHFTASYQTIFSLWKNNLRLPNTSVSRL